MTHLKHLRPNANSRIVTPNLQVRFIFSAFHYIISTSFTAGISGSCMMIGCENSGKLVIKIVGFVRIIVVTCSTETKPSDIYRSWFLLLYTMFMNTVFKVQVYLKNSQHLELLEPSLGMSPHREYLRQSESLRDNLRVWVAKRSKSLSTSPFSTRNFFILHDVFWDTVIIHHLAKTSAPLWI